MLPTSEDNWKISTHEISLATEGHDHIVDLTAKLQSVLAESRIAEGQVLVFIPGATASVTTLEFEPGLLNDVPTLLDELIPNRRDWKHNQTWGDGNGGAHLRAALIGPSLTIPVVGGQMTLGTWQQVVLIDHDNKPRTRRVVVQVLGLLKKSQPIVC